MKTTLLFSMLIAPIGLGALGVFFASKDSSERLHEVFLKASAQIREHRDLIEEIRNSESPRIVPDKKIDKEASESGFIYHMLERQRVNRCDYYASMKKGEVYDIWTIEKNKDSPDKARLWAELNVTKWRKWGRSIVDEGCFRSERVTLERKISSIWKGSHYWLVIGHDENGKETYRNWFWQ